LDRRKLFRDILEALEERIGRAYLNHILDKVLYDLSAKFGDVKSLSRAEDPYRLEIENLSREAFEELILELAEVLEALGGKELRREFIRRLERLNSP
jgi:hypothetical protein